MASTSTVVRKYHANYLASNEYFAIALDHVPLLTDSGNYLWWKLHVSYALKAAGYWGHVDGSDSFTNEQQQ
ncbi:hypothetical protein JR316_0011678 [Psilocybe cubensis]|uniref:Uncharacterized protein n=1 Tax=Psilocybe cubensis TaxID=181762 RepID=A0ACB8GL31_PSICU|nr:hypothetical protein JR316_0011678 [Psilocybe cubensis]KAH9476107.1 hypothetical protein JR316_0011678 [Psilocybe cubensis]